MTGTNRTLLDEVTEGGDRGLADPFEGMSEEVADSGDAEQAFYIVQDGTPYEIAALDAEDYGGRTVEEFYAYGADGGSSANTPNGMEKSGLSQLFFYDGPEGTSLVVIHDEPQDGDGGEAILEFDRLPRDGEWAVPDDPSHAPDEFGRSRATWRWGPCCTDGGAYRGGFDAAFWVEITPDFVHGIDSTEYDEPWVVVDGSDGDLDRLPLDPGEPITIASAGTNTTSAEDPEYEIKSGGEFCVAVESDKNVCVSREPILKLGRRDCTDVGGKTPPLASVEITYFEESETADGVTVTFERNLWVGFELWGDPCIWYGEENLEICARLEGCTVPPRPNADGVPEPDAVLDLADDVVDDISDEILDISLPNAARTAFGLVMGVGILALAIAGWPVEAAGAVVVAGLTIVIADENDESDDEQD